jgi:hypothetical protein
MVSTRDDVLGSEAVRSAYARALVRMRQARKRNGVAGWRKLGGTTAHATALLVSELDGFGDGVWTPKNIAEVLTLKLANESVA